MFRRKFQAVVIFVSRTNPSPYVGNMFGDFITGLVNGLGPDLWTWFSEKALLHMNCLMEGPLYFIQQVDNRVEVRKVGLHKPPFQLWGTGQSLLVCGACMAAQGVRFGTKAGGLVQSQCETCYATSKWTSLPENLARVVNRHNSDVFWVRLPIGQEDLTLLSQTMAIREKVGNKVIKNKASLADQLAEIDQSAITQGKNCMFCGDPNGLLTCVLCQKAFCTVGNKRNNSKVGCVSLMVTADVVCPCCYKRFDLATPVSTR